MGQVSGKITCAGSSGSSNVSCTLPVCRHEVQTGAKEYMISSLSSQLPGRCRDCIDAMVAKLCKDWPFLGTSSSVVAQLCTAAGE